MLEYLVFRLLSLVAPLLPSSIGYWLCDRVGDLAYLLLARQRSNVRGNLSRALRGRREGLERRVRRLFREGARYYYDTFRVPALRPDELSRMISVEGWEHLERAVERGRGVILFTAHLGSPALVAQILAVRGYRMTTPMEPVKNRRLLDLMTRVRSSHGIRLIPAGHASIRELSEALRRNEILGVVVDRDLTGTGVEVELFGAQTPLPAGPALLALRLGAVLLPAFTYRREDGRFAGVIRAPLEVEKTGDLREDIRLATQRLARELEKAIERKPEQWVVFEPLWADRAEEAGQGLAR